MSNDLIYADLWASATQDGILTEANVAGGVPALPSRWWTCTVVESPVASVVGMRLQARFRERHVVVDADPIAIAELRNAEMSEAECGALFNANGTFRVAVDLTAES